MKFHTYLKYLKTKFQIIQDIYQENLWCVPTVICFNLLHPKQKEEPWQPFEVCPVLKELFEASVYARVVYLWMWVCEIDSVLRAT